MVFQYKTLLIGALACLFNVCLVTTAGLAPGSNNGSSSAATTVSTPAATNVSTPAPKNEYCSLMSCKGQQHVACDIPADYFHESCSIDADVVYIAKDNQDFILKTINELRNKVARGGFGGFSAAARMATLSWNEELAHLAEMNVRHCRMLGDFCHNTKKYRNVGQTLGYRGHKRRMQGLRFILARLIKMWSVEEGAVTMLDILEYKYPNGKPKENFLQLILQNSNEMGCGVVQQSRNGWLQTFLTCYYAQSPIVGKPIYQTSTKGGEGCNSGINPNYESLCSVNESYDTFRKLREMRIMPLRLRPSIGKPAAIQLKPDAINATTVSSNDNKNETTNTTPDLNITNITETTVEPTTALTTTVKPQNNTATENANNILGTGFFKRKFRRFFELLSQGLNFMKSRRIVIITSNHEVDVDTKQNVSIKDERIGMRSQRVNLAISSRNRIKSRGISGRTRKANYKVAPRTNNYHGNGFAKWVSI